MKLPQLVVLVAGLALGVGSLAIARSHSAGSFGGASTVDSIALLGAGWALVVCGVIAWARRPASRFGWLLAGAGCAWFLVEFNNPAVGSSVVFTVGLLAYAVCPALVAHAALTYPGGRLAHRAERAGLLIAYTSTLLVLGLLPTLVFDPATQGCSQCPRNLLQLASAPELVTTLDRVGIVLGLIWAPALAALALTRTIRSSPAARLLTAPVLLPAVAYLVLVSIDYAHSRDRGFLSNDGLDHSLWLGQAAAVVGIASGVVLTWVRGWRARTAVARLVIELSDAPAPARLRDALARALDDPALELAFPLGPGLHVDEHGHALRAAGRGRQPRRDPAGARRASGRRARPQG